MDLYKWRICIQNPFDKCENIYPIQQRKVKYLLEQLKKNPLVKKVIIFGSSITPFCHAGSDVDIYVELSKEISKSKLIDNKNCDFEYDFWTNYTVDQRLLNEINRTGLVIYEEK